MSEGVFKNKNNGLLNNLSYLKGTFYIQYANIVGRS